MAERVQLRRVKGYRKPEGAVVVARPSKWGNPWTISEWLRVFHGSEHIRGDLDDARGMAVTCFRDLIDDRLWAEEHGEPHHHAEGVYPELVEIRAELRGKDLACWCPLDQLCHADVLLEVANRDRPSDG